MTKQSSKILNHSNHPFWIAASVQSNPKGIVCVFQKANKAMLCFALLAMTAQRLPAPV